MLKHPSVQATVGKGARIRVISEHETEHKTKLDAFTKIFGQKIFTKYKHQTILGWKDLLVAGINIETSLMYYLTSYGLSLRWGGMLYVLGSLICSFLLTMPIFMMNLFFGQYSRRSFIRVWDMVPIFRGIGWTVAAFQIMRVLFCNACIGICFMYIPKYISHGSGAWQNCDFEEATPKCIPMYPETEFTENCCRKQATDNCSHNFIQFSSYEYFRYHVIRYHSDMGVLKALQNLNWEWIFYVCLVWLIIYLFMVQGFRRFKTVYTTLALCTLMILSIPLILLTVVASGYFETPNILSVSIIDLTDFQFWVSMIRHVLVTELPGSIILLGAYSKVGITPDITALIVFGFKFFITTVNISFLSMCVSILQSHYKVKDSNCFDITGYDVVFAIVPDILSRLPLHQVPVILWYLLVGMWTLFYSICMMTCLLETLTDSYPKLLRYRLCTCSMLCFLCALFNFLLLNPVYLSFFLIWEATGNYIVITGLLFPYLIAIFTYSLKNIMNDYHFTFGVPLKKYWTFAIKFSCLISAGVFVLMMFQNAMIKPETDNTTMIIVCYGVSGAMLLLVPCYIVYLYIKFQTSNRKMLLVKSEPNWGPSDPQKKQARRRFNPQREMRYKSEVIKCKHNCLLNSSKIKDEIEHLNENRQRLLENFQDRNAQSSIEDRDL